MRPYKAISITLFILLVGLLLIPHSGVVAGQSDYCDNVDDSYYQRIIVSGIANPISSNAGPDPREPSDPSAKITEITLKKGQCTEIELKSHYGNHIRVTFDIANFDETFDELDIIRIKFMAPNEDNEGDINLNDNLDDLSATIHVIIGEGDIFWKSPIFLIGISGVILILGLFIYKRRKSSN